MMTFKELGGFVKRRAHKDSPAAFAARLARFGVIAAYLPSRNRRLRQALNGADDLYPVNVLDHWMMVDASDPGISADLAADRIREPYITNVFRHFISRGDTVLDVGANIGYYAIQEAALVGAKGRLICIEPVPANVQLLKANLERNKFANYEVHQCAAGDADGQSVIHVSVMRNMCSMIQKQGYRKYVNDVPVPVVRLDTFMQGKPYPNVVRMDTEGYELPIVRGMKGLFALNRPMTLFIEWHFDILQEASDELVSILYANGFDVKCATFECHPAVRNRFGERIVKPLERIMGAESGIVSVKLKDFRKKPFINGQVEDLEVLLVRS